MTKSNRRRRVLPSTPRPARVIPTLTVDEAYDLGDELLEALTPHAGNARDVDRLLTEWADARDVFPFSLIVMAALRTVFAERLKTVPTAALEPGDLTLNPQE